MNTQGDEKGHQHSDVLRGKVSKKAGSRKKNIRLLLISGIGLVIVLVVLSLIGPPKHAAAPVADNPVVREYRSKLPQLKTAAEKTPSDFSARQSYGQALYVTGDKKAARSEYEAAVKINPKNASIRNDLGNVYRDLADYAAATASYKKAYEIDPTLINAYVNLATMQAYTLNKPADAVTTYKLAVSKNGQPPDLLLLLGGAYEKNDQKDLALSTYRSVLSKDPNNTAAKRNIERLTK